MTTITELIRRADERLRTQDKVTAGLDEVVKQAGLDDMPPTSEALVAVQKLLTDRKGAFAAAQRRIRQLEETVAQLSRALPFLQETWPQQRDRLEKAISDDPQDGLADWLSYWFAAASTRRASALRRLLADVHLPSEYQAIEKRLGVAARGLDEDDWLPCREILLIGAAGVRVGRRQVPDRPVPDGYEPDSMVREGLRLLAARLALHHRQFDQAEVVLGTDKDSAARLALLSRSARLRGKDTEAEDLLAKARDRDPADLDVATESIERARQRGGIDAALDSARAAVEALASLGDVYVEGDVEGDVGRLVQPPGELWIALAERARDEDDRGSARLLLNRAVTDDNEVLAVADEVHTTVTSGAERRRQLLRAGYRWANACQLDRARRNYEAATDGTPADEADAQVQAAARLRLADNIAATARQRPYNAVAKDLEYALGLVRKTRPRGDWSYLTECDLCIQLSRVPGRGDALQQEWAALLAAARAVSARPEWAASWQALADAATAGDLYRVAEAAAARAHRIEPGNQATQAGYVRALVNTGRYTDALECLGDADDPDSPHHSWWQCVRGLIALRQGRAKEAVDHYAGLRMDPAWLWAWNAFIRALVIADDLPAARRRSAELMRTETGRDTERSWLAAAAFHARLNGQLEAARAAADRLAQSAGPDDFRARYAQAETQLLSEDQAGWELLARALVADPRPAAIDVWEQEEFPVLAKLAAARGITLRPPANLDSAVQELRIRAHTSDPVPELQLAAEKAAVSDAEEAVELIEAMLLTAMPDGPPAETSHGRSAPGPPDQPLLRLPKSWLAGSAAPGLDTELREYVTRRMELSGAEDLEPDGYELLIHEKVRDSGHLGLKPAVKLVGLLTGEHRLSTLLTRPAAEVIAAAYYQVTPPSRPVLLTVPTLAHRTWELRGRPDWGTERADQDVAERAYHQFVAEDAYYRWEKRGRPLFGDPLADWLPAEQEITQKGIVPGTGRDEHLHWLIALQDAYFNWLNRGRPLFGNPQGDWPY